MYVVKILSYNDGEKAKGRGWCLCVSAAATDRTLCDGVAYGYGDSSAEFLEKENSKQKVTCPDCIDMILKLKTVRIK